MIFGSQATKAMDGPSRKKREAQADPTFLESPAGPEASAEGTVSGRASGSPESYPSGTDRGRKTSAGTQRAPEKLASKDKPAPRKDAKPSPARQFGPGTSGGRWQHRPPFRVLAFRNWGSRAGRRTQPILRTAPTGSDPALPESVMPVLNTVTSMIPQTKAISSQ